MTTTQPNSSPPLVTVLVAFAIVYLVWGSTYLGIRIAIETLPPFSMAALRFLVGGVILFVGARLRGAASPRWVEWRSAFVVGVLLLVTGNGVLTWAEQYVASGVAALIVATVPMWMVMLDTIGPGGSRPRPRVIVGLVLGLGGIAVLIGPGQDPGVGHGEGGVHTLGALAILAASLSWAVGSLYSRRAPQSTSTLLNVGMQMLLGGGVLLVWGLASGERIVLETVSARSAWALVYLTLFGGVISYSAYVWLLKVTSPAKASTYAYVNPVVAVVLGWALAGESLDARILMSMVAVVVAVVLITTGGRPKRAGGAASLKTVTTNG